MLAPHPPACSAGKTPLNLAIDKNQRDVVGLLRKVGAAAAAAAATTANRLQEEGNKLLKENKANEAISKFVQSLCRCAALCLCRLVCVISAFDIVTSNQVH